MHLYLMRHGVSIERDDWSGPDECRPLTSDGRKKTRAVVKALKKAHGLEIVVILTSPLTRARETAEIAGEVLKAPVEPCNPLGEGAALDDLAAEVRSSGLTKRLMLVGHEPDLGYLLASLLGEQEPRPFKKAGVAYLTGEFRKGGMKLEWQVAPKEVLGEGP